MDMPGCHAKSSASLSRTMLLVATWFTNSPQMFYSFGQADLVGQYIATLKSPASLICTDDALCVDEFLRRKVQMRNIASLILVLGIVAGFAPTSFAEETAAPAKEATKTECPKHAKKHCKKATHKKAAAPKEEAKTETK